MKKLKTGGALGAQAERSGNPSRNGRPIATVPAPRRNARRLIAVRRALGRGRNPRGCPSLVDDRTIVFGRALHGVPPTWVRNALFLTRSTIICLTEPLDAMLVDVSAVSSGMSLATMSRCSAKLASFFA